MSNFARRRDGVMIAFAVFFPLYYTATFYNDFAIFYYYPLVREVHFHVQHTTLGPSMAFYGWVAAAAMGAALTALVMPAKWREALWPGWLWLGPSLGAVFTFIFEGRWLVPGAVS